MERKAHLTHIASDGSARMVSVADKPPMRRRAKAQGKIFLQPQTLDLISSSRIPKGDVLSCANIAGVMAAKKTQELIPLTHNIFIEQVTIDFTMQSDGITISAQTICTAKTGIEMEALTAVSVAALTIWDMCKAVDKTMKISDIVLLEKSKERVEEHGKQERV